MENKKENKKMIKLRSSDNEIFEVEEAVMLQSETIKFLIEDVNCSNDNVIPLESVHSNILAKVIHYCTKHSTTTPDSSVNLNTWDDDFVNKMDQSTLLHIIMAANYLEIKSLFELTCEAVAKMIRGKTTDEIRETFNIKSDFTPEEEAQIRIENQWAASYSYDQNN